MNRIIEQSDLDLTLQHILNLSVRVEVYDKDMNCIVGTMDCALISGSFNMDANSDVRRTASLIISPMVKSQISLLIEEDSLVWVNRNIVLYVGIQSHRTQEYTYYKLGTFLIMTYSSTYDATTNQLTLNCSDWMAKLDGTKNGELSALTTSFPAYKEFYSTEATGGTDCYFFPKEMVNYSSGIIKIESPIHTKYTEGDYVVIQMPYTNVGNDRFRWNSLSTIDIYDLSTGLRVRPGVMLSNYNYAFRFTSNTLELTSHIPIDKAIDGVPINYYIIRDAMITAITRLGGLVDYNIDDIGEYYAMPQYNDDYEKYRAENPLWNNIPYDLKFNVGDTVLSIVTTLRDLYPNYECYFNEDGIFCCNMVPSDITDDVFLNDDYLQKIIISENYDIDTTTLHNVCEVWGQSLEVDFTAKKCTLSGDTYTIDIDEYGDTEFAGDKIAIQIENVNPSNAKIIIHTQYTESDGEGTTTIEKTFSPLEIYDEMTDSPLDSGVLEVGTMYVFKIKTKLVDGTTPTKYIYLQSEFQPQAIDVLTDGTESSEQWTCADGTIVNVWSKKYFADKFGCKEKNIHFTLDASSAFTIQKCGEILSVKQGGEYENITSDQRALARATYENWKNARLVDSISITVKLCLFLDVNKKIEFRRHDQDEIGLFIITSVSHDFTAGTSSVTMTRFWPLYMNGYTPSTSVIGVKGDNELSYRTGDVNLTKFDIGLGDVGDFKAVSTVESQELTATEKTNACNNIGVSFSYNSAQKKLTISTVVNE